MAGGRCSVARLAMGELEAAVMDVLWDRGGWSTPGEVHLVLGRHHPVAYTTVMTILVRLWQKGRLERERDGRAFAYHPILSREEAAADSMQELLGVLALPAWARPAGRRLPPSEWSRLAATALVGGALAVETGLALLAAPTVLRAARVP